MDVSAISGISNTAAPETGVVGGELGKNEFLELLATQISNQDPLDPADSADMIAQLAQFSGLEQMQNLNSQFTSSQRDNTLTLGLQLTGQELKLTMNDGNEVQGVVENVVWDSTKEQAGIVMDGVLYSMPDILAMAAVEPEAAAAETPVEEAVTEAVVGA